MANNFLAITNQALKQHGKLATYVRVASTLYDIETGKAANTDTNYSVQMYKKHIKASQYNYPNLVGKDSAIFYVSADSIKFIPNVRDKIVFDGVTYNVDSYMEHSALGQVVLLKIIGVKG